MNSLGKRYYADFSLPCRRFFFGALPLLALFVLSGPACESKPKLSCETLAKRNALCADAFVEEGKSRTRAGLRTRTADLPLETQQKAMQELEVKFRESEKEAKEALLSDEFRQDCERDWDNPEKTPPELKAELERCLSNKDCASYVACFIDAAKLSP